MPLLAFALSAALASPAPDTSALRAAIAAVPTDGSRGVDVDLPLGDGAASRFRLVDSRTLPNALMRRYPGLRSLRGQDAEGRTVRIDVSGDATWLSVRDGAREWSAHWGDTLAAPTGQTLPVAYTPAPVSTTPRRTARSTVSGDVRYDFRLAVAASSRYTARVGGTVEQGLAAVAHAVNRANDVFETDLGVHFTLVDRNDRLIFTTSRRDPFESHEPGPAAVDVIERRIGASRYDIGHALTTFSGGHSESGTTCSDDRSTDDGAMHKAFAWSGDPAPDVDRYAQDHFIHVLGLQLGAVPTANGCLRGSDLAVEPGSGSTAMGYASLHCASEAQWLQDASDRYFHASSIEQIRASLASRGGACARRRLGRTPAPWIDRAPLAGDTVIPARTPFFLEAHAMAGDPGRRLTYTWEQIDTGPEQKGALVDDGIGPLFRSLPPSSESRRTFPRLHALLGHEPADPAEALPTTSRTLRLRLTVRDNGGDDATTASADTRVRVVDTGRPFSVTSPGANEALSAGASLSVRWDVAGTAQAPIGCGGVRIDLSTDGGLTWPHLLARNETNDGEATTTLPDDMPRTDRARVRVSCESRPFFAVSPADVSLVGR
ncbi:reprolysin-like metallopeptidase [Luteibacter sahnii]|uniref:reprolysin-like metallopeptidase n=1 Tax=Luteibacter sahnii TaxID=3021977 RepID=UPI002A69E9F2|nr:zinc-dependent metalloprotease family protein [Luteibacter sp. PPL193]MDY1548685.1 zinc-dependent metalloprotease family protein [Luteibacter sp. PPL193]